MYPKLKEYSFVKRVPEKDANIFSYMQDADRKIITINESASSILRLCDGIHSIEDIAKILNKEYNNDEQEIYINIKEFIQQFLHAGIIEDAKSDTPLMDIDRGSSEAYLPNVICWEITDYCPLDCRHCYIPEKNNYIIGRDEIDRIIDEIKHMGAYQIQITGGEALTNPEFGYILKKLSDMKLVVCVSTSGFYSNDDIWEALENLKSNPHNIMRISLDGNERTHNYIRRNKKAYSTAIKFIKEAVKIGINCQIGTCLIDQTPNELEDMIKLAKEIGVKYIEIGRVSEQGNAEKNNLSTSWSDSMYQDFLQSMKGKYETIDFKIRQAGKQERRNCGAGYLACRIKPNLDVTPCPMIEIKMGNLGTESIDDIMKRAGKYFYFLETPQEKFCSECEKNVECKNCTAKGYNNKDRVARCIWYEKSKNNIYMKGDAENL